MGKALGFLKEWAPVAREVATVASLIAIPLILFKAQSIVDERLATQDTATQYVQLALDILRDESKSSGQLRNWAVRVLDTHALVKLTAEEKAELLEHGLAGAFSSKSFSSASFGPGFDLSLEQPSPAERKDAQQYSKVNWSAQQAHARDVRNARA